VELVEGVGAPSFVRLRCFAGRGLNGEDIFDGEHHTVEGGQLFPVLLALTLQIQQIHFVKPRIQLILPLLPGATAAGIIVAFLSLEAKLIIERSFGGLACEGITLCDLEEVEGVVGIVKDDTVVKDGTLPAVFFALQHLQLFLKALIPLFLLVLRHPEPHLQLRH
jgi:hypothetical protein